MARKRIKIPADIRAVPVTRQRKYQMALERLGMCRQCGEGLVNQISKLCGHCLVRARETARVRRDKHRLERLEPDSDLVSPTRRNKGSKSYTDAILPLPPPPREGAKAQMDKLKHELRREGFNI